MKIRVLPIVAVMLFVAGCVPPGQTTGQQGTAFGGTPANGGFATTNGGFANPGSLSANDPFGNQSAFNTGNTGFNSGVNNSAFGSSGINSTGFGATSGFNQGGFTANTFGNTGFDNSGFGNQGFGNQGFVDPNLGNQGFGNQGFGNQGFVDPNFGNQGFGSQGFGNQAFVDPNFGNQGFGAPIIGSPAFGHPAPGHHQDLGHTDHGHGDDGHSGVGIAGTGHEPYGSPLFGPTFDAFASGQLTPQITARRASHGDFEHVAVVQQLLQAAGFSTGPIDGKLGSQTIQAIRSFQRQNFLPITGHIDTRLVTALAGHSLDKLPGSHNNNVLREYEVGNSPNGVSLETQIAIAQRILGRNGFEPGPVDGRYGPYTSQAIRDFQLQSGIEPTGEVTPELLTALQRFDQFGRSGTPRGGNPVAGSAGSSPSSPGIVTLTPGSLDRPGLRSDVGIGAVPGLSQGMTLNVIADGQIISLGRETGSVRLNGLLIGTAMVANQTTLSYDAPMVNELGIDAFGQYDSISLNWRGFLMVQSSGQHDIVMQTDFDVRDDDNYCDIALMFRENGELVPVIKRRLSTERAIDRANLFLDEGLHEVSAWIQCKEIVGIRRFRSNLLMRGPGFELAQPISEQLMLTAEDFDDLAQALEHGGN